MSPYRGICIYPPRGSGKTQKQQETQSPQADVVDISKGQGSSGSRRGSIYPYEVCREWALHCVRRGDNFPRGVDYFAGWVWKFGRQDEDIRKWMRENPRGREVARAHGFDSDSDSKAG